jgi:hypothetical protein
VYISSIEIFNPLVPVAPHGIYETITRSVACIYARLCRVLTVTALESLHLGDLNFPATLELVYVPRFRTTLRQCGSRFVCTTYVTIDGAYARVLDDGCT